MAYAVLAGLGVLGWKEGWDEEKIKDRAYRLHHSTSQNRADNFTAVGGVGGGFAAYALGALLLSSSLQSFLLHPCLILTEGAVSFLCKASYLLLAHVVIHSSK